MTMPRPRSASRTPGRSVTCESPARSKQCWMQSSEPSGHATIRRLGRMVRSDRRLDTLHDEHSMKQSPRPNELDDVRGNGRMTWREADRVWFTAPEEVLHALS